MLVIVNPAAQFVKPLPQYREVGVRELKGRQIGKYRNPS